MVDVTNQNVKRVLNKMNECMQRKRQKRAKNEEDIILENRLFYTICDDYQAGPTACAVRLNNDYGYDLTSGQVIDIFHSRRMANPYEREELLQWAEQVADQFAGALSGTEESFERFEVIRRKPAVGKGRKHPSQERIAAVMIFSRYPEIDIYGDSEELCYLGNTLGKYYFYDMADAVSDVYGFEQHRETKKNGRAETVNMDEAQAVKKAPDCIPANEQTLRKISQLETALERANIMIQELQDEFNEQLDVYRIKELTDFFSLLNSEKYGCILDELLIVRKGIDELKRMDYELPVQISGLIIMVKKLTQFVRDNHIDPIMKVQDVKNVRACDIESCRYEGSPFTSADEVKRVRVLSPGWIYRDKQIQISRPRVREESEEETV